MRRVDETTEVTKCTEKDRISDAPLMVVAGVDFSFFLCVLCGNCRDVSGDFAES